MLKNYRRIGSTKASYINALGSGASQGGGGSEIFIPIVDKINLSFGTSRMMEVKNEDNNKPDDKR